MGGQANPDRRQALTASGAALATLLAGCASAARPAARTSAGRQPASARAHNGPPAAPAGGDEGPGGDRRPRHGSGVVLASAARLAAVRHRLRPPAADLPAGGVPRAARRARLRAGYTTITPDHYLAHLTTGTPLPARPVLLSFDGSQGSQVSEGLPQLRRRSMTATFFVMTVVLGKSGWMSRDDLRRLDAEGMTIAAHTWDHHRADQYRG